MVEINDMIKNDMIKNDIINNDKNIRMELARKYIKSKFKLNRNINDYYILDSKIEMDCISDGIYKAISKKNNKKYIIKKLYKVKSAYKEIFIQQYLKSSEVLKIIDIFSDISHVWVVYKYARDGDLFDMFKYRSLSYVHALNIIFQISTLLKKIHSLGIIHGDLKMENILLDKYKMYICDFGFSVFSSNPKTKICLYTNPYTAPEQLNNLIFDFKSDVWSLGIILYTLCFDCYPFEYDPDIELEPNEMYLMMINNKINYPDNCPNKLVQLINGMLKININERYSLDKVREMIIKF